MQTVTSLLVKLVFAKHEAAQTSSLQTVVCSTAIMYDLDVHFLCLDFSNAFDTPTRNLILRSI